MTTPKMFRDSVYYLPPTSLDYAHGCYWPDGAPDVLPPTEQLVKHEFWDKDGKTFYVAYLKTEIRKQRVWSVFMPMLVSRPLGTVAPAKRESEQMDAVARGSQMLDMKMTTLPLPALKYAAHLCDRFGMGLDVMLTAYAAYAQIVENLPCADEAYAVDATIKDAFNKAQLEWIVNPDPDGQGFSLAKRIG